MNILIIGCKFFNDYQVLKSHLDDLNITLITTFCDENISTMAARYADENNIKLNALWPEEQVGRFHLWKEYYKVMLSCDMMVACWFGKNKSVLTMIKKVRFMEKEVIVIRGYHPDENKIIFHKSGNHTLASQTKSMHQYKYSRQFLSHKQTHFPAVPNFLFKKK